MKLHLPVFLRKAVLACFASVTGCTLYSGGIVAAEDITLGASDSLTIDYASAGVITDLAGGTLQLMGDTELLLTSCGSGDGKTYSLFTGVSELLDAEGNVISLDSSNNAIAHYFDTSQPGNGFWAGATLVLTDEGTLQLVRHHETVKEPFTMTSGISGYIDCLYYAGVVLRILSMFPAHPLLMAVRFMVLSRCLTMARC